MEALLEKHKHTDAQYEPELFPGLIFRKKSPKVVILIFASGKIVMAGAKSREDVNDAFGEIYPILHGFRKENSTLTRQ